MVDFTKIKSKYVLKKLKTSATKSYIEDLMTIERLVTADSLDTGAHYKLMGLERTFSREFVSIYKELNPDGYKRSLDGEKEMERKIKSEDREFRSQERKEKLESKKTWEKMKKKIGKTK